MGIAVRRVKPAECLAMSIALVAMVASTADASNVILSWPESKQPIRSGETVVVGDTLHLREGTPPCQTFARGQLIANSKPTDQVSGITNAPWDECGATHVSGAFGRVKLHGTGIVAVAKPAITITEPGPCVYGLHKVSGSGALQGSRASFAVSGQAMLTQPRGGCASKRRFEGTIGLFGPQSGGFGLLLWELRHASSSQRRNRPQADGEEH
jgi:hypothetical protein